MAAYRYLIDSSEPAISEAVAITDYGDQSSFSKKFKKVFKVSPGTAIKEKNPSLFRAQITWEELETGEKNQKMIGESQVNEPTVFGVNIENYKILSEVFELQSFYGLSEEMSKAAYDFSRDHKRPLAKTFQYFFENVIPYKSIDYIEVFEEDHVFFSDEAEYIQKVVLEDLENPEWIYLFFDAGFTDEIYEIIDKARGQGVDDVRTLSMTALRFLASDIGGYYGLKAADYYDEHANEEYNDKNLEEYIQWVDKGYDYELAFEAILTDAAIEKMDQMMFVDFDEDNDDYNEIDRSGWDIRRL